MALAHIGTNPHGSPRLRILICVCELAQTGKPPTYREIQHRLGMSAGAVSYHIERLQQEGSLVRSGQARDLSLTPTALSQLIAAGWLVPARPAVAFELSIRAIELLELAPE